MSGDAWNKRKEAQEEEYFRKQNQQALNRLQEREEDKPRLSPISGEPMEQLTYMGVVIDRCKTSGGIWLDAGELEQIIKAVNDDGTSDQEGWVESFFSFLKTR